MAKRRNPIKQSNLDRAKKRITKGSLDQSRNYYSQCYHLFSENERKELTQLINNKKGTT